MSEIRFRGIFEGCAQMLVPASRLIVGPLYRQSHFLTDFLHGLWLDE
jgi:hypothetical protein